MPRRASARASLLATFRGILLLLCASPLTSGLAAQSPAIARDTVVRLQAPDWGARAGSFETPSAEQTRARVLESGRYRVIAFPGDERLARSLLAQASASDSFPGMPRPTAPVVIAVAPDERRFREWVGPRVPEWGAAVAFPGRGRIVVRGSSAGGARAGDPSVTLRHELAHLALREYLEFPAPRWFDEGYASFVSDGARRGNVLAANLALVLHPLPSPDSLNHWFLGGATRAQAAYALAHSVVEEHARRDPERGLELFLRYWKETGSYELAVRRAYGVTSLTISNDWRRRVRMRYGALALLSDAAIAGVSALLLVGPVWIIRRRRDRRKLEALREADSRIEQAERAAAIRWLVAFLLAVEASQRSVGEQRPPSA